MTLGKGIAIAGIWIGAAIMTAALAFSGVLTEITNQDNRMWILLGPAGIAGIITFFSILLDD